MNDKCPKCGSPNDGSTYGGSALYGCGRRVSGRGGAPGYEEVCGDRQLAQRDEQLAQSQAENERLRAIIIMDNCLRSR